MIHNHLYFFSSDKTSQEQKRIINNESSRFIELYDTKGKIRLVVASLQDPYNTKGWTFRSLINCCKKWIFGRLSVEVQVEGKLFYLRIQDISQVLQTSFKETQKKLGKEKDATKLLVNHNLDQVITEINKIAKGTLKSEDKIHLKNLAHHIGYRHLLGAIEIKNFDRLKMVRALLKAGQEIANLKASQKSNSNEFQSLENENLEDYKLVISNSNMTILKIDHFVQDNYFLQTSLNLNDLTVKEEKILKSIPIPALKLEKDITKSLVDYNHNLDQVITQINELKNETIKPHEKIYLKRLAEHIRYSHLLGALEIKDFDRFKMARALIRVGKEITDSNVAQQPKTIEIQDLAGYKLIISDSSITILKIDHFFNVNYSIQTSLNLNNLTVRKEKILKPVLSPASSPKTITKKVINKKDSQSFNPFQKFAQLAHIELNKKDEGYLKKLLEKVSITHLFALLAQMESVTDKQMLGNMFIKIGEELNSTFAKASALYNHVTYEGKQKKSDQVEFTSTSKKIVPHFAFGIYKEDIFVTLVKKIGEPSAFKTLKDAVYLNTNQPFVVIKSSKPALKQSEQKELSSEIIKDKKSIDSEKQKEELVAVEPSEEIDEDFTAFLKSLEDADKEVKCCSKNDEEIDIADTELEFFSKNVEEIDNEATLLEELFRYNPYIIPPHSFRFKANRKNNKGKKIILYQIKLEGSKKLFQASLYEKLNAFIQAAKGLSLLHKKNYVHGDVKPDNFLLKDDQLKLADFGTTTKIGGIFKTGSTAYLPKENVFIFEQRVMNNTSSRVTPSTDSFCFGLSVLEMLYGHLNPALIQELVKELGLCSGALSQSQLDVLFTKLVEKLKMPELALLDVEKHVYMDILKVCQQLVQEEAKDRTSCEKTIKLLEGIQRKFFSLPSI